MVQLPKDFPEYCLQLMERGIRNVFLIKALVRKIEFLPESWPIERWFSVGGENAVGGLKNRGQVVHQRAGPVEDEVTNQE